MGVTAGVTRGITRAVTNAITGMGSVSLSGAAASVSGTTVTVTATSSGDLSSAVFGVEYKIQDNGGSLSGYTFSKNVVGAVSSQSITVTAADGVTSDSTVTVRAYYNLDVLDDPSTRVYANDIVPYVVAGGVPTGTQTEGQTLTQVQGVIAGSSPLTVTYQWQNDGGTGTWANISSATSATYVLQTSDVGDDVAVVHTATNSAGSDSERSAETGAIASAFTPASISGLQAWYRFDTGLTLTGSTVDQWADQSGNARHLTQLGANAKPTRQSDGTIRFDSATAQCLQTAAFTAISQPLTVVMRMRNVTWTNNGRMQAGGSSGDPLVYMNGVTPEIRQFAGSTVVNTNTDLAVNTYGNVFAIFNGASSSLKVDANAAVSGGNPGTGTLTRVTLSATNTGANPGNTQFCEVMVYSVALTAGDITNLNAWLDALPV